MSLLLPPGRRIKRLSWKCLRLLPPHWRHRESELVCGRLAEIFMWGSCSIGHSIDQYAKRHTNSCLTCLTLNPSALNPQTLNWARNHKACIGHVRNHTRKEALALPGLGLSDSNEWCFKVLGLRHNIGMLLNAAKPRTTWIKSSPEIPKPLNSRINFKLEKIGVYDLRY